MNAIEFRDELIDQIMSDERIKGVGQTGSIDIVLVPGKSDIDLFVLCTEVPEKEERQKLYSLLSEEDMELQMEVCTGGQWGYGDIFTVGGIDVMPMYFPVNEMRDYLQEILDCKHLEKEGRFYPVGRLASIATIQILKDKEETWQKLKDMVNAKQDHFFKTWFDNEIGQVLDEEDLGRAELRKEVLFFHQVLESALDHLLQALYAVNETYFPSRKRTLTAIEIFDLKPMHCGERLLKIIQDASTENTLTGAIDELRDLTDEIKTIGNRKFEPKELSEMNLEELYQLFPIVLTEHDERWSKWYQEEELLLKDILKDAKILRIEHIGSTAISGIMAKPTVDILIEVPGKEDFQKVKDRLNNQGYICMSQNEKQMTFNKGYTKFGFAERVFHIHVRMEGDHDEIFFRDYLNTHPAIAKEYESLKLSLKKQYRHDRDAYTEAKAEFIKKYTDMGKI